MTPTTETTKTPEQSTIENALLFLAGRCDGAVTQDGVGFNGRDTQFGHSLADQISAHRNLSPRQLASALTMLKTYKKQLEAGGIVLPDSMPVPAAPAQRQPAQPATTIRLINDQIHLRFKYEANLVDKIRNLRVESHSPGWNGDSWVLKLSTLPKLIELGFAIPDSIRQRYNEDMGELAKIAAVRTQTDAEALAKQNVQKLADILKSSANPQTLPAIDPKTLADAEAYISGLYRKPFAHQWEYVQQALRAGGRQICALDVGLGKTYAALIVASLLAAKNNNAGIWVIAPISLHDNWRREAKAIGVGVYMISWAKIPPAPLHKFALIADECFPYNTAIHTDVGIVSIGDIVEKGIARHVMSYNVVYNAYEWKPITARMRKPATKRMVRVHHSFGSFVCTEDHKIYVEGYGYKKAVELTRGWRLRTVRGRIRGANQIREDAEVLFENMREPLQGGTTAKAETDLRGDGDQHLSDLRQRILDAPITTKQTEVLLNTLCQEGSGNLSRETGKVAGVSSEKPRTQAGAERPSDVSENAGKQSNEELNVERKDDGKTSWTSPNVTLWERSIVTNPTTGAIEHAWGWMDSRVSSKNKADHGSDGEIADVLQGGHSEPASDDGDRGGRVLPQHTETEVTGQEEGASLAFTWVAGIEVIEQEDYREHGGCGERSEYVYDITVGDNHNYFANGVLVSNCHAIQHWRVVLVEKTNEATGKKTRTKEIRPIRTAATLALTDSPNCISVQLLTGTPVPNGRPIGLWPSLKACNHWLAKDKKAYEITFCDAHATQWSKWDVNGVADAERLHQLHALTNDVMFRRKKTECIDLPPITREMKPVELSTESERVYTETFDKLRTMWQERVASGEISDKNEALVMLGQLLHATSVAKVEHSIETIRELVANGNYVIASFMFKDSLGSVQHALEDSGIKCGCLTGDTPPKARQPLVDQFQAGELQVMLVTYGAGGVGLNLQRGDYIWLHDRPWRPGDVEQIEGRAWRVGRTDAVISIWPQCNDADTSVDAVLNKKQGNIDIIVDGKESAGIAINVTIAGKQTILPDYKDSIGEIAKDLLAALFEGDSVKHSKIEPKEIENDDE